MLHTHSDIHTARPELSAELYLHKYQGCLLYGHGMMGQGGQVEQISVRVRTGMEKKECSEDEAV